MIPVFREKIDIGQFPAIASFKELEPAITYDASGTLAGYDITGDGFGRQLIYFYPSHRLTEEEFGTNGLDETELTYDHSFAATFDDDDFITVKSTRNSIRRGKGRIVYVMSIMKHRVSPLLPQHRHSPSVKPKHHHCRRMFTMIIRMRMI